MRERFTRKPHSVHPTERDLDTVEAMFAARYLTGYMVRQLFYPEGAASRCRARLRKLYDARYLDKRQVEPTKPDIYFLALRGRRYITSLGQHTKEEVDRVAGVSGARSKDPSLMMRHDLRLSRLYVNLVLECRRYDWGLTWQNSRMLELKRMGVQPDAFLQVRGSRGEKRAFIEYTEAMPSAKEMQAKLSAYEALFAQAGQAIPVLWLTTSRDKMVRLARQAFRSRYKEWFALGLMREGAGPLLTKPMWRTCGSEQAVRFIAIEGQEAGSDLLLPAR